MKGGKVDQKSSFIELGLGRQLFLVALAKAAVPLSCSSLSDRVRPFHVSYDREEGK